VKLKIEKRHGGFTLVEVILAMTIFSLIAVILYGAFYLSQRAIEKAAVAAERGQRERMLGSFLAGYVRSAFPYRASSQDQAVFFDGEANRLTFVSALSRGLGGRGMAKVTIQWDGELGAALTLEEAMPVRLADLDGELGHRSTVVLYPQVDSFHVHYLATERTGEQWIERWDGAERKALPRAVRIRLRPAGENEREWVLPVMINNLVR
jgi:general secretion pathway protein J